MVLRHRQTLDWDAMIIMDFKAKKKKKDRNAEAKLAALMMFNEEITTEEQDRRWESLSEEDRRWESLSVEP
jgi:hypothetical protein